MIQPDGKEKKPLVRQMHKQFILRGITLRLSVRKPNSHVTNLIKAVQSIVICLTNNYYTFLTFYIVVKDRPPLKPASFERNRDLQEEGTRSSSYYASGYPTKNLQSRYNQEQGTPITDYYRDQRNEQYPRRKATSNTIHSSSPEEIYFYQGEGPSEGL